MLSDHLKLAGMQPSLTPPIEKESGFQLTVVFTTVFETLEALKQAARLADRLDAEIRILVAHTVPYPLPIERPRVTPDFHTRTFQTFSEQAAIETHIDVRLCRDAQCCIQEGLAPASLVVIGIGKHRWPFTREKNVARRLRRAGHQVISVTAAGTNR